MQKLLSEKIVFIFTPGPIGGAEKVISKGIEAMSTMGSNVELWLIKELRAPHLLDQFIGLLTCGNLKIRVFETKGVLDFSLIKNLQHTLSETNPSIVHAHGFKSIFYSYVALPERTKLVVTHHGRTSHTFKVRIYELIESYIMKHAAHAVIAVSSKMKSGLSGEGIDPKKVHVVENLLSLSSEVKALKRDKQINLLFAGRLSPEKGCVYLLEALSKIPSRDDLKVTILGDGVQKSSLEQKMREFSLENTISFQGHVSDISPYLAKSDALVMPSLREGQPLSLIEACCSGIPVIASSVGGIPELINHDENGLLFEAGSASDLAKKISEFMEKKNILSLNALNKKEVFQRRFSERNWVINTMKVYTETLNQL